LASSGRPLSQIVVELGIPAARVRAWCNRNAGSHAGSPRRPNTQAAIPPAGLDLATESVRLRRENERLRTEREILKKRCASSRNSRNEVPRHRRSARDIPGSCPVRYHGRLYGRELWLARPSEGPRKAANPALLAEIRRLHLAHRGRYGGPRIHAALYGLGHTVSHAHAPSWYPGNNTAPVPSMHHQQPP
jgi:transposase-like protein